MRKSQFAWFLGLVTCISGALVCQAELLGEPTRHYVTILFIAGTAATGYMLQPTRDPSTRSRDSDPQKKESDK